MVTKSGKAVTAISKVVNAESQVVLQNALDMNIWAQPSRASPNGEKLKDGAIQRMSVTDQGNKLRYVAANPDGIGFYKREELNVKAGDGSVDWSNPWDTQKQRYKIARIYMPQRKHLHCHPTDKNVGKHWRIDFGSWGHYRSPLMGWGRATQDSWYNVGIEFGQLKDAIGYAEAMGWGYDVSYPNHRWHAKKNYADNFKWKGLPKETEAYD